MESTISLLYADVHLLYKVMIVAQNDSIHPRLWLGFKHSWKTENWLKQSGKVWLLLFILPAGNVICGFET